MDPAEIEFLLSLGQPGANPKAMADALRSQYAQQQKQQMLGQALGLVGDKRINQFGQGLVQSANQGQEGLGRRLQMALQGQQQAARQGLDEQQLQETTRHNKQMERLGADRPSGLNIIIGEGGQQLSVDPRTRVATPITDATGKPIIKPRQTPRPMPSKERDTLQERAETLRSLEIIQREFKNEFAGGGPLGGLTTGAYQTMGALGSKAMQADAAFWSKFQKLVELGQRHTLFGASLTPSEQRSWERAQTINPKSDPALVREVMREMEDAVKRSLSERGESLIFEGFDEDAVKTLMGQKPGAAGAGQAKTVVERRQTKDGRTLVKYSDGSKGFE